jgi:hypothetical protein
MFAGRMPVIASETPIENGARCDRIGRKSNAKTGAISTIDDSDLQIQSVA